MKPSSESAIPANTEKYRAYPYRVKPRSVRIGRLADGASVDLPSHPGLEGASVSCVADRGRGALALALVADLVLSWIQGRDLRHPRGKKGVFHAGGE
jgi:hypothetical protein